jgi:AcrR family transcriptional regulator
VLQESVPHQTPGAPVTADGTAARLLDATIACVARVGVSKTTLDDVAREAGCSRATLYRHFPGKPALLGALVGREAATLRAELELAAAETGALEERSLEGTVVAVVTRAAGWLAAHPALQFVMVAEPELLLPHLAFDGADRVLGAGASVFAPSLERFLGAESALRTGEWLTRIVLSYVSCPAESVDLLDPASVRRLVADFVVPGLPSIVDSPRG